MSHLNESTSFTITCYYQNVRGYRTKTNDLLVSSTAARQYDIVAFIETWLNDDIYNAEIFNTNLYDIYRCDRNFNATNTKRGGVLIALNKKLNVCTFDFKSCCDIFDDLSSIDIVSVRLKPCKDNNHFYIFVVYVPPQTISDNYEKLFDAFDSLYTIYGLNILIMGDFNIPEFITGLTSSRNFNLVLFQLF